MKTRVLYIKMVITVIANYILSRYISYYLVFIYVHWS